MSSLRACCCWRLWAQLRAAAYSAAGRQPPAPAGVHLFRPAKALGRKVRLYGNDGDTTTLVEMDPVSGDKLWQLTYDDIGIMAYRSDWADGCDLFANAAVCPTVAARVESLAPLFAE
jgi:hypothetical protein